MSEFEKAVVSEVPLIIGITGSTFSGKTVSALRLAAGMQRVYGGEIGMNDTESGRGKHHAKHFSFLHLNHQAPFGPMDYVANIEKAKKAGVKVLIIDQMTYEHSGPGGVMDQSEKFLDDKCGDNIGARQRNFPSSLVAPKRQRRKMIDYIVQVGAGMAFIILFRAQEKMDFKAGGKPTDKGWQPETTSPLRYEMTQHFLLTPGSEGIPTLMPSNPHEKNIVKSPSQFAGWFKPGIQLNEDIGEKFARWAKGEDVGGSTVADAASSKSKWHRDEGGKAMAAAKDKAALEAIWTQIQGNKAEINETDFKSLEDDYGQRLAEFS